MTSLKLGIAFLRLLHTTRSIFAALLMPVSSNLSSNHESVMPTVYIFALINAVAA